MLHQFVTPKAVLRQQKVKSLGALKARSNHNTRTSAGGLEHTDPTRGGADVFLGSDDALDAWHKRMDAVGLDKSKLRSNAVPAVEWVASVSPVWFKVATPEMIHEWVRTTTDFVAEKMGGQDNILQAVLHTDETTPHLQFLTIPLTEKEIAARGRGSKDKPKRKVWSLSATDAVGGHRSVLEGFQTDYAARLAPLGIQRGTPRKETGARNLNPSKWRAMQASIMDTTEAARRNATALQARASALYQQAESAWEQAKTAARVLLGNAKAEKAAEVAQAQAKVLNTPPPAFAPETPPEAIKPASMPPALPVKETPQRRPKRNTSGDDER